MLCSPPEHSTGDLDVRAPRDCCRDAAKISRDTRGTLRRTRPHAARAKIRRRYQRPQPVQLVRERRRSLVPSRVAPQRPLPVAQSPLQDALLIPAQLLLRQRLLQNIAFPGEPLPGALREFTACPTAVVGGAAALVFGWPRAETYALRVHAPITLARCSRTPQCTDEIVG